MKMKVELTNVEKYWLMVNAYHEARGESDDGVVAVCHVVLNRAARRNQTVYDVITAPSQFSWTLTIPWPVIKDYKAAARIMSLMQRIESERLDAAAKMVLPLEGADHYYAPKGMAGGKAPGWAAKMRFLKEIGGHRFYVS